MENKDTFIITALGTLLSFLFGQFDLPLRILLTFMIMDFITGLLKGWYGFGLSSKLGYRGLIKKCGILCVVIVAVMLDLLTGQLMFRVAVCYFFIAIEGISILENLASIGVPIPQVIMDRLTQIKDAGDAGDIGEEQTTIK